MRQEEEEGEEQEESQGGVEAPHRVPTARMQAPAVDRCGWCGNGPDGLRSGGAAGEAAATAAAVYLCYINIQYYIYII